MITDIFEYRRQARAPRNYFALGLVGGLLYLGWAQGWGLVASLLCGPFLAMVLVRLVANQAEGFRMTADTIDYYGDCADGTVDWNDLQAVTLSGDGAGGARCLLHLDGGRTEQLPATSAFAPERLAQEFRLRGIPVWRAATEPAMARA